MRLTAPKITVCSLLTSLLTRGSKAENADSSPPPPPPPPGLQPPTGEIIRPAPTPPQDRAADAGVVAPSEFPPPGRTSTEFAPPAPPPTTSRDDFLRAPAGTAPEGRPPPDDGRRPLSTSPPLPPPWLPPTRSAAEATGREDGAGVATVGDNTPRPPAAVVLSPVGADVPLLPAPLPAPLSRSTES